MYTYIQVRFFSVNNVHVDKISHIHISKGMYTYIHTYIHTCIHTGAVLLYQQCARGQDLVRNRYSHMYACVCAYVYARMCMYASSKWYLCMYSYACMHVCMNPHACIHVIRIRIRMRISTHTHTHVYIHTYTPVHTCSRACASVGGTFATHTYRRIQICIYLQRSHLL